VSKRLPQGIWKDSEGRRLRVLYYDSRSRCYRIEYLNMMGMRRWAPVEEFGPGKTYQSLGVWGFILGPRGGLPSLSAVDFSLVGSD
jgi:hypothetical protein